MRGRRSLLKLSDRAIKALQKIDRGRGDPTRIGYHCPEIEPFVKKWMLVLDDDKLVEHFTLNREGRDFIRGLKKPRREERDC